MNRPEPAGADVPSQPFRVVLIRLIDLHLESGAGKPSVETNNFKSESAEFMHQPWRHRANLDANAGVIPACRRTIAAIRSGAVGHWPRHSLRPALSTQMAVIFCETSKPTKWAIMIEPPMMRITGQRRPDRGTIERSGTHRDYRMSTELAVAAGGIPEEPCGKEDRPREPSRA